ncbi:MAG: nucleotide-binding protein [candidate division Zixibacteria bacterium]|nr:nucleotide-binding protein [candidate division Zixibacteria bacterium]
MSFNLGESNDQLFYEAFHDGIDIARSILNSMIDEINKFWENEDIVESTEPITAAKVHEKSNKVFIVHGHDESAKQSVARLLEKLDLSPIILHEQPDKGKTIIEKFEEFSDVGFAVILLTPDDIGGIVGTKNDDLSERARQNVIFELGYFIGKIGRSRVCALHVGNVEILSDYSGVLFKKMGSGEEWKYQLGKELKAAGYGVDLNNI